MGGGATATSVDDAGTPPPKTGDTADDGGGATPPKTGDTNDEWGGAPTTFVDVAGTQLSRDEVTPQASVSLAALQAALREQMAHLEAAMNTRFASLQEEVRSNFGHVTKRLFKPLDDRVTALKAQTNEFVDRLTEKGSALFRLPRNASRRTSPR